MEDKTLKIKITTVLEPKTDSLNESASGSPFGDIVIFTQKKKFIKPTIKEITKNIIKVIQYDSDNKGEQIDDKK